MKGSILLVYLLFLSVLFLGVVSAVTYTETQIKSTAGGLALATISTATKICEIRDSDNPVVESFGRPYGAQDSYGGEQTLYYWNQETEKWSTTSSKYEKCVPKPILRTLTCRSSNVGEVSRLTNPHPTVTIKQAQLDIYKASLPMYSGSNPPNPKADMFGLHMNTLKHLCEYFGYNDIIDNDHSAYCNGGNWILYTETGGSSWDRPHYDDPTNWPNGGTREIVCEGSCGNGICDANECKTAVSGKKECRQDCQYQCSDGCDNDNDVKFDYCKDDRSNVDTCDPSCSGPDDDDEGTPQCDDGEDNDDDNLVDYCKDDRSNVDTCDPDCDSPGDSEVPECSDGIDDDGDGKTDYCDGSNVDTCDPNCQSPDDDSEACEDDQIIMKLETEGNSLGALWNDANYKVDICYDEIFGEEYVGDNPHSCDEDNKVLGLEHSTKAFAEKIDSTVYDFDNCDGADVDRNKIVEKADLEEYIEKLKSDCRNIGEVDLNLVLNALNDNNFDKECTTNNNFCELLDINLDGELTPKDLHILRTKMSGCTGGGGTGNPNIDSNADLNEDGYVNYLDREIFLIALADNPIGTIDCNEDDRSNNVCYGDLRCRSIDTSDSNPGSCDGTEEKIVASLSAATGAMISKGDDTGSSIKICCKLEVTQLESAYWAYMNDEIIEPIDSAGEDVIIGLKDKVKLVVEGKEFKDKNINYEIFKKCSGFWGCLDAFFTGADVVAQTTVKGEFIWDAGKKLDDDTFSEGKYYFSAKIGELKVFSSENSDESENLNGILTVGPEDNDPPVAKIKFPLDRQIYFVNSPITFEQGSFDLDDEFSYSWNLGDGTVKEGDSSTLENYDFDYTYLSPGQKNIELTVTDDRGLSDTAKVSILVIASDYLLSYIESPAYNEEYGQNVEYDASGTYVISSEVAAEGCTKTITCLAGDCPAETKGVPTSESLGCDYDGDDEGIDVVGSLGPDLADYSEINFCWDFKENVVFEGKSIPELCRDGDEGGLSFSITYPSSGRREVSLTASWGVEPAS